MKVFLYSFISSILLSVPAYSEPSEAAPSPPPIHQTGEHTFQIGNISLNKKTREISFPATVNYINSKVVEALVVHKKGRTHESIFTTTINAINLNIAFKLLGAKPSAELFQTLDENLKLTGKYPEVSDETKKNARMQVEVLWKEQEKELRAPAHEWIALKNRDDSMPATDWLYSGSYFLKGNFRAQTTGDLISIYAARPSVMNYPGTARENDEVWFVHNSKNHLAKTPVTILISVP